VLGVEEYPLNLVQVLRLKIIGNRLNPGYWVLSRALWLLFQVFDGYIYVDFWKKGYYSIIRVRSIGGFG